MQGGFYRHNGYLAVYAANQMNVFGFRSNQKYLLEIFLLGILGSKSICKNVMAEIKNHIRPGSVIYSDCWKGYDHNEPIEAWFSHFTVNHRYNFIDPETAANTQKIERLWGSAKWRNKKHRGTARHHLDSYLAEFMCRQKAKEENFLNGFLEISELWPPK